MPYSTTSSIATEPVDLNFAFFIAKPLVGWSPLVSGLHAWMRTCSVAQAAMQREWSTFVERRLQADIAQIRKLNETKSCDAWRLYYEFYEKAVEDYRAEYGHLVTLGSNMLNESMSGTMSALTPKSGSTTLS